jgi:hypothetical protein
MEKDFEGNGPDLIQTLLRHFTGGTEENHKKPQSGQSMSLSKALPPDPFGTLLLLLLLLLKR